MPDPQFFRPGISCEPAEPPPRLQTVLCPAGSLRGTRPGQSCQKVYCPEKQLFAFLSICSWWIFSYESLIPSPGDFQSPLLVSKKSLQAQIIRSTFRLRPLSSGYCRGPAPNSHIHTICAKLCYLTVNKGFDKLDGYRLFSFKKKLRHEDQFDWES